TRRSSPERSADLSFGARFRTERPRLSVNARSLSIGRCTRGAPGLVCPAMLSPERGGRNMSKDPIAGTMLIAGALLGVVVMALHPTGRSLAEDFQRQAALGSFVHGVAIASIPVVFLGLFGLWRRLGGTRLATAGLVAYAWAG